MKIIRIIQIRSSIGLIAKRKSTLINLGLKHIGHIVDREDTPSIRGMIYSISHIVKILKEIK
ncbi:MAG: 50S ribosomal protein L30 [Enterobacterales bacterium]